MNLVTELSLKLNKLIGIDKTSQSNLDNIICVNIANDKELIPINDYIGLPKGNVDITDRSKIALFLSKLNNGHKFIILDVILDPKLKSTNDSILNSALTKTDRIIIPSVFKNQKLIQPVFEAKTGFSSYKKSIFTNRFVKYTYLEEDSIKSIPLKMSNDINGNSISKNGLFYFDNGRLCLNSIVLNYEIKPIKKYNNDGIQNFYELGNDILESMSDSEIQNLVKDKIILIGDFDDRDLHPTIYGKISGVLINYNAYLSLKNGSHIITKPLIIFLFLFYFFVTTIILYSIDIKQNKKIKNWLQSYKRTKKVVVFINKYHLNNFITHVFGNYLKIGFLFTVLSVSIYLIFNIHIEILRTSTIIGTLILIRDWIKMRKKSLNEN